MKSILCKGKSLDDCVWICGCAIIQALCVGVMCAFCYRLGARGKDEMQHVVMMMLQRSEEFEATISKLLAEMMLQRSE